jgi:hypothetical protein
MLRLGRFYQLLLIVFMVLGLFYPAIFASGNSVDDYRMLQGLSHGKIDFWGMFLPSAGFYYRPLLMLTFWFDQSFWDGTVSFMHLENLLLHAANAVLVYFLAEKSLRSFAEEVGLAPLLAGLLFAVHPITTESVNWISGRTDLLGTFFVLLTSLALLTAGARRSLSWVVLSVALFACAIMSKEIMVFFFPAACLLLWHAGGSSRASLRLVATFALPFLVLGAAFFALRLWLVPTSAHGVNDLLAKWHYDFFNTLRVTFKVFGFYVKKLFVPVPLNFTIRQVSDFYTPFGLGAGILSGWLLVRHYRWFFPFAVAFWMIVPAILVALTSIAWTPLAERYIYLSAAFVAVGIAPLLIRLGCVFGAKVGLLLLVMLLVSSASVTALRTLVWQDNRLLFADTLDKNPDFAAAHNELGIALMENGKKKEAEKVLREAIDSGKGKANALLYVNLANVYLRNKEFLRARQCLQESFVDLRDANPEVLKMLARVSETALRHSDLLEFVDREVFLEDMVRTYRAIYARNGDTSQLYRAGQLLLALKRNDQAADVFAEVVEKAPVDSFYYPAAKKLAGKLKTQ